MAYTVSIQAGRNANQAHNRRDPEEVKKTNDEDIAMGLEPHITVGGHFEVWRDFTQDEALHKLLDKPIEDYNARQKRKDRCTTFEKEKSRALRLNGYKKLTREIIIEVGSVDDHPLESECRRILRHIGKQFQAENPNFLITGVYYHADEPGIAPHIHIDYIPFHKKRERGIDVQIGQKGALEDMGYTNDKGFSTKAARKEGAQAQWNYKMHEKKKEWLEELDYEFKEGNSRGKSHQNTKVAKVQKKAQEELKTSYDSVMLAYFMRDHKEEYNDFVEAYESDKKAIIDGFYEEYF